ncbi:haloacid dehalogenase-like hydrolase, partial [Candidatus Falkowbacteria bacterium]|nr:haloacid dehalogenase-like hydrolase [Candidatus Falkowbacteria bacterium]
MNSEILISNPTHFESVKNAIIAGGAKNLHIISDFDRTLTSTKGYEKMSGSLISILRDKKYLTPDYPARAQAYADHYKPIEYSNDIPLETKKGLMLEWWNKHLALLIECGLTKQHITDAMQESGVDLREGVLELLQLLHAKNIPIVIFSANGLGYDSIAYFLQHRNCLFNNIHIVSNRFAWDEQGKACGIIPPLIHSYNKDEHSLLSLDFYQELKHRKNVILLGDSEGDLGM